MVWQRADSNVCWCTKAASTCSVDCLSTAMTLLGWLRAEHTGSCTRSQDYGSVGLLRQCLPGRWLAFAARLRFSAYMANQKGLDVSTAFALNSGLNVAEEKQGS